MDKKIETTNQTYLRRLNQKKVFSLLLKQPLYYTEIAQKMNLSNTAISKITDELIEKKILLTVTERKEKGRPPIVLTINPEAASIVAIDISPKKETTICFADLSGRILERKNVKTAIPFTKDDAKKVIGILDGIKRSGIATAKILSIYIAVPDDCNELIESDEIIGMFAKTFDCNVKIERSVKLSMTGELAYGELATATKNSLFLYCDSTVDSALMVDGKTTESDGGFKGSFLNMSFVDKETSTEQSVNSFLSVDEINRKFTEIKTSKTESKKYADVFEAFANEDEDATALFNKVSTVFANVIHGLTCFIPIQSVVINGDITKFSEKLTQSIREKLKEKNPTDDIDIVFSNLKNRAAVVGALTKAKLDALDYIIKHLADDND